jgi:hypothetical protein
MIILDDDILIRRIPAKKDNRVFKFEWKNFKLFKENSEEEYLTEDAHLSIELT